MTPAVIVGALAGMAVAAFKLGEGPLAFQLGVLIGGALGGAALGWIIGRLSR